MTMNSPRQFSPRTAKPIAAFPLAAIENDPSMVEADFRAAVRGERPVKSVVLCEAPDGSQRLRPADVAEGIINLNGDPSALSEWANFILATSDSLKIRGADCDYWDRLLAGIWEIALGIQPKHPMVALAHAICARQSRRG